MTYIQYEDDTFSSKAVPWMSDAQTPHDVVELAVDILDDYGRQGYTLTLRQLFYQFVSRSLFDVALLSDPKKGERVYKNFGALVAKARDFGLLSWSAIEDRDRSLMGWSFEEDEHELLADLEYGLVIDRWARMSSYVEVWVEKKALENVVAKACRRHRVPYMATKGYLSVSEAWRAGRRFREQLLKGKSCTLIHLGDHDPEGVDMTRDNEARIHKYAEDVSINVERIALNMDQIEEYNPPPNYAKASSSRFDGYVSEYGETCWELDALEPAVIENLIHDAVEPHIEDDVWQECDEEEDDKRRYLSQVYDNWDEIKDWIDQNT